MSGGGIWCSSLSHRLIYAEAKTLEFQILNPNPREAGGTRMRAVAAKNSVVHLTSIGKKIGLLMSTFQQLLPIFLHYQEIQEILHSSCLSL